MRLALFQPDIPQNLGAAMRLAACMGIKLDIIEPCGFPLSDRAVQRAAMDYAQAADIRRHDSWSAFVANRRPGRLLLLTTRASVPYASFRFAPDDILLLGRESAGAPEEVHALADARLVVPMAPGARSLNVIVSAAMVLGEALRQLDAFPAGGAVGG
jgi:tRNA (cytidine/uridine-2'-O-)-methyltransferase